MEWIEDGTNGNNAGNEADRRERRRMKGNEVEK